MALNRTRIRELALELLDDSTGITEAAWEKLKLLLIQSVNQDLIEMVKVIDGRAYLTGSKNDGTENWG